MTTNLDLARECGATVLIGTRAEVTFRHASQLDAYTEHIRADCHLKAVAEFGELQGGPTVQPGIHAGSGPIEGDLSSGAAPGEREAFEAWFPFAFCPENDAMAWEAWQARAAQASAPEAPADRRILQADGKHPAPCAKFCEATAFKGEIQRLKRESKDAPAERRPLTDEQIRQWWSGENGLEDCNMAKLVDFTLVVRAVEQRAHGITGEPS